MLGQNVNRNKVRSAPSFPKSERDHNQRIKPNATPMAIMGMRP